MDKIIDKKSYKYFCEQDRIVLGKAEKGIKKPKIFGDEVWKYIIILRKCEYHQNTRHKIRYLWNKFRLHYLGIKLGFYLFPNCFGPGLAIAHYGCVHVSPHAKIGKNCYLHQGVTIGVRDNEKNAPLIGDNVIIGSGAKIIGKVVIANKVVIGANAVVVRDILEEGTTWGGVPAKKISENSSQTIIKQTLD